MLKKTLIIVLMAVSKFSKKFAKFIPQIICHIHNIKATMHLLSRNGIDENYINYNTILSWLIRFFLLFCFLTNLTTKGWLTMYFELSISMKIIEKLIQLHIRTFEENPCQYETKPNERNMLKICKFLLPWRIKNQIHFKLKK